MGVRLESRKLIKFGQSSYVVSIPKDWIRRNNLKKGDSLFLEDYPNKLVFNPSGYQVKELKKAVVDIDNKLMPFIQTELTTIYLSGYDIIEIRGDTIEERAEKIKEILKNFAGIELMEETSKKIVVKDLIDIREISIKTIIRRIDLIIRGMIDDALMCFDEDHYESVNQRDVDVNRLVLLLKRIIRKSIENRSVAIQLDVTMLTSIKNHRVVDYLEAIGDCTKRISRVAVHAKISPKYKKDLCKIFLTYKNTYIEIMKAYHTNNIGIAYRIELDSKKRLKLCEDFEKKCSDVPRIVYNLKSMSASIKHITRAILDFNVKRELSN